MSVFIVQFSCGDIRLTFGLSDIVTVVFCLALDSLVKLKGFIIKVLHCRTHNRQLYCLENLPKHRSITLNLDFAE